MIGAGVGAVSGAVIDEDRQRGEAKRRYENRRTNRNQPREVHHFCLLIGYGAQAINPYMAFEGLADMIAEGQLP